MHPDTAPQSAATPILRINDGTITFVSLLLRETESVSSASRFKSGSILGNDGPPEFVIQTQRHDRVGAVDNVGQLTVGRENRQSGAGVPAKIVVAIFHLADHVVGQRVCDTATGSEAAPVCRELIYARYRGGVGMKEIAIRPAAGEEQQQAVNGDTASRTKREAVAKAGRVVRAERKVVIALDAGPEPIGFDTDQVVAALRIVADLAASNAPRRGIVDSEIRQTGRARRIVEIVIAIASTTEHADVET